MRVTRFAKLFAIAVAAIALGAGQSRAAIIPGTMNETIVESRAGGKNFANYAEDGGGFPNSWMNSGAKSTAPGTTAGIGSRFNSNAGIGLNTWFQVSPTLPLAGGIYEVYVTTTTASGLITASAGVSATGGTGLPATTTAFSTVESGNIWGYVGTITLNSGVSTPTVRFNEGAHNNRFYADAVLFAQIPEPATFVLAGMGLAGVGLMARRRHA